MAGSADGARRRGGLPGLARRPAAAEPATAARPHGGVVDWALYRDGVREPGDDYAEAVRRARAGDGFVWIGLYEPEERELAGIAADFGLHPLAVEDAVVAHQRPKLERYGDSVFAVLKTLRYVPHASVAEGDQIVETGEVMVFLGHDFVVTVRHGEHGGLRGVRRRLEADRELLARGPSSVLHAVADTIVDTYLEVAEMLEEDVDEIEEQVFAPRRRRTDIGRTYELKRELLELRRAVSPLATPLRVLAEQRIPVVDDVIREYFRDVEDHLTRAREAISAYDELLSSVVQAGLAQLSIAENEDMRKITAYAALIAVPTAIAGIYGMNFEHMPELGWRLGYPLVLLVMAGACLLLWRSFKRSGWI